MQSRRRTHQAAALEMACNASAIGAITCLGRPPWCPSSSWGHRPRGTLHSPDPGAQRARAPSMQRPRCWASAASSSGQAQAAWFLTAAQTHGLLYASSSRRAGGATAVSALGTLPGDHGSRAEGSGWNSKAKPCKDGKESGHTLNIAEARRQSHSPVKADAHGAQGQHMAAERSPRSGCKNQQFGCSQEGEGNRWLRMPLEGGN